MDTVHITLEEDDCMISSSGGINPGNGCAIFKYDQVNAHLVIKNAVLFVFTIVYFCSKYELISTCAAI